MRIVKPIFLSSVLVFALPTTSATLGGSSMDVGLRVQREVGEGSSALPVTTKPASRASFLNPSYILNGIQNVHLPPALRVAGVVQAFTQPEPPPSDFWERAKEIETKLQEYVHGLLEAAATYFKSTRFTDITSAMNHIVGATADFRDNITDTLEAHQITLGMLTEELEGMFMAIVNDLEKIPPPDKAPSHAERKEMVDKVLDDTSRALIDLAARYGIEQRVVTEYLLALKPQVEALVVAIGDINEQHPELLPALAFSVAVLLIPEAWILRPFLSVFGFGPAGPVKGSVAAWLQRRFWGAAVTAGSWFSWLQAAGMGVLPKWAWLITKMPWLIGGLLAILLPCLTRG